MKIQTSKHKGQKSNKEDRKYIGMCSVLLFWLVENVPLSIYSVYRYNIYIQIYRNFSLYISIYRYIERNRNFSLYMSI